MARRMKTEEQMDLLEEGGLKDEGGTVDPVSGNDVPPGSTQEEVRDDIPAQLSEGEFVFPADVTRYIGLENLMELRQKAKMGLQKMEDMGQMGNSEEAIMSDSGEFEDSIDKTIEALPMAMGGMVTPQPLGAQVLGPPAGNTMPGQSPMPMTNAFQMQPSTAMNQTSQTMPNLAMAQGGMVPTVEQEMMQKGRQAFARGGAVMPVEQEMMQKSRQNFQVGGMPQPVPTVTPPTQVPTYSQFMGQRQGQGSASPVVYGTDQYIGPNGDIIGITTINGQPVQDVPAGYKKYNPATDTPATPAIAKPEVQQGGDGGEDRAREEARDLEYARSLTEMKELSQLSPSYKEFVEENLPSQYNAAQEMKIDPETGLPSFPGISFQETMKGLLGGQKEAFTQIKEGLSGIFGDSTAEKAYQEIADVYGLDVADYQTKGLFGSRLDTESLRRDAMVANAVAKSIPGLERENIKDVIARTQFERGDDGRIDPDSLVDRNTGELTQTGKDLFGQTLSDEEEAELLGRDSGDGRKEDDDFDARDMGDYDPGGMASEGKGDTKDYSKGGAVKPKRKKGLGRLK